MRLILYFLLLALTGVALAQDTNFSSGPQYLITNTSPQLLQPISTPTLSLSQATHATDDTPEINVAKTVSVETGTSPAASLADVFWGDHPPAEADARRIATPSMSLSQPATPLTEATSESGPEQASTPAEVTPLAAQQTNVIEITSGQMPPNLPESMFNPGVTARGDRQSLLNGGYGMTLGQLAAYWKSNKRPASHVITNEDLERKP